MPTATALRATVELIAFWVLLPHAATPSVATNPTAASPLACIGSSSSAPQADWVPRIVEARSVLSRPFPDRRTRGRVSAHNLHRPTRSRSRGGPYPFSVTLAANAAPA